MVEVRSLTDLLAGLFPGKKFTAALVRGREKMPRRPWIVLTPLSPFDESTVSDLTPKRNESVVDTSELMVTTPAGVPGVEEGEGVCRRTHRHPSSSREITSAGAPADTHRRVEEGERGVEG